MQELNGVFAYRKIGFRFLNVHRWDMEVQGIHKTLWGCTVAIFCLDLSVL